MTFQEETAFTNNSTHAQHYHYEVTSSAAVSDLIQSTSKYKN